jgi:hypothetical protein
MTYLRWNKCGIDRLPDFGFVSFLFPRRVVAKTKSSVISCIGFHQQRRESFICPKEIATEFILRLNREIHIILLKTTDQERGLSLR